MILDCSNLQLADARDVLGGVDDSAVFVVAAAAAQLFLDDDEECFDSSRDNIADEWGKGIAVVTRLLQLKCSAVPPGMWNRRGLW